MDFYRGGSLFLADKLKNIMYSLESLYHPDFHFGIINNSIEAVTPEKIQVIIEVRILKFHWTPVA